MKLTSSILLVASLLTLQGSASESVRRTFDALHSRQSVSADDFPEQCQSQCTTVLNTISSCTTDSCICTSSNASGMESCVNCLVSIAPSAALESEGEQILDTFNEECSGVSGVPSLTISGASASASGAVSSGFASATATRSSTGLLTSSGSRSTALSNSGATATSPSGVTATDSSSASEASSTGSGLKGANGAVSVQGSIGMGIVGVLASAALAWL